MARKEKTNRALISALSVSNSQPYVPDNQDLTSALSACNIKPSSTTLVVPPPPYDVATAAGATVNTPTQINIATLARNFPKTNFNLQSVIKKCDAPIYDEGSRAV